MRNRRWDTEVRGDDNHRHVPVPRRGKDLKEAAGPPIHNDISQVGAEPRQLGPVGPLAVPKRDVVLAPFLQVGKYLAACLRS